MSTAALLYATHLLENPIADVADGLFARLREGSWVVVLKTLIVFHRLFKTGHEVYTAYTTI